MHCEKWNLSEEITAIDSASIDASLLFLPVLKEPKSDGVYTVINSIWEKMGPDGNFDLPKQLMARRPS